MEKEIEMFKNLTLKSKPRDTQVPSMEIKDSIEQGFTRFEFITKKKGAFGPTQEECDEYYKDSNGIDILLTVTSNHGSFSWIGQCRPKIEVLRDGYQTFTIPVSAEYKIEIVAPGYETKNPWYKNEILELPGTRIKGNFKLKKGQKITVALGQQGTWSRSGCGGSFLVLESDKGPKPLLIAGAPGYSWNHCVYWGGKNNFDYWGRPNPSKTSSGKQFIVPGDKNDIFTAGAGFSEAPKVSNLTEECVPPKTFQDGLTERNESHQEFVIIIKRQPLLTGGKGKDHGSTIGLKRVTHGGFGGGGAYYTREVDGRLKCYGGAGGGFSGGGTFLDEVYDQTDYDEYGYWVRIFKDRDLVSGRGGGSFSAGQNTIVDEHHYVEYGYCKIEKLE